MKVWVIHLLESFRYRNFLWLWLIVALTNTGKWIFTLAVTWQVYNMTGSAFWSGALMFASMFPNIVGAPFVGVLADKIERRLLMYSAIGFTFVILILFAIFTVGHELVPVIMIILALLFGLGTSTLNVSINSVVPTVIPKESLYNAYSLQAVGQRGTEFVGPIIAAPILASLGVQYVYFVGATMFVFAILFTVLLTIPRVNRNNINRNESFISSLTAGFKYIQRHRSIREIVILVGLHCALTMAFLGMLPRFVQHNINADSSFYGVLMSMVGLGSIAATLLMAGVKKNQLKMVLFWISGLISGLSLVLLGIGKNELFAIIAILLVGSSQALFMTLTIAFIQEMTEEHVRGRVTSVYFVLAAGLMSLANWGYGWLSNVVNPQYIMLVTGFLFFMIFTIYMFIKMKNKTPLVLNSSEKLGA